MWFAIKFVVFGSTSAPVELVLKMSESQTKAGNQEKFKKFEIFKFLKILNF